VGKFPPFLTTDDSESRLTNEMSLEVTCPVRRQSVWATPLAQL